MCRQCSTLTSTNRISNTAPQHLANSRNAFGELRLPDTKIRGSSLGNHNIVLFQEFSDSWPEPCLSDGIGFVLVFFDFVLHFWARDGREFAEVDFVDDFAENATHVYAGVLGVADYDVGAVKVDCVELGGFVGEASCVEITLYGVSTHVLIS